MRLVPESCLIPDDWHTTDCPKTRRWISHALAVEVREHPPALLDDLSQGWGHCEAAIEANSLSALDGLDPCYLVEGYMPGAMPRCTIGFRPDCLGYRLPTSVEWEYVARAAGWPSDAAEADEPSRPIDLADSPSELIWADVGGDVQLDCYGGAALVAGFYPDPPPEQPLAYRGVVAACKPGKYPVRYVRSLTRPPPSMIFVPVGP